MFHPKVRQPANTSHQCTHSGDTLQLLCYIRCAPLPPPKPRPQPSYNRGFLTRRPPPGRARERPKSLVCTQRKEEERERELRRQPTYIERPLCSAGGGGGSSRANSRSPGTEEGGLHTTFANFALLPPFASQTACKKRGRRRVPQKIKRGEGK